MKMVTFFLTCSNNHKYLHKVEISENEQKALIIRQILVSYWFSNNCFSEDVILLLVSKWKKLLNPAT